MVSYGSMPCQVTALSNIEAKKKFEFLEAVSGTMDAHLRYFKQVQTTLSAICTHIVVITISKLLVMWH